MLVNVIFILTVCQLCLVAFTKGECGENASEAPSPCAPTCEFQHSYCSYDSLPNPQPGCRCKTGTVFLNEDRKTCVNRSQCPKTCRKPNFSWKDCGSGCPTTCQQKSPKPCLQYCESGCFCNDGYLLDPVKMECVPKNSCP